MEANASLGSQGIAVGSVRFLQSRPWGACPKLLPRAAAKVVIGVVPLLVRLSGWPGQATELGLQRSQIRRGGFERQRID